MTVKFYSPSTSEIIERTKEGEGRYRYTIRHLLAGDPTTAWLDQVRPLTSPHTPCLGCGGAATRFLGTNGNVKTLVVCRAGCGWGHSTSTGGRGPNGRQFSTAKTQARR